MENQAGQSPLSAKTSRARGHWTWMSCCRQTPCHLRTLPAAEGPSKSSDQIARDGTRANDSGDGARVKRGELARGGFTGRREGTVTLNDEPAGDHRLVGAGPKADQCADGIGSDEERERFAARERAEVRRGELAPLSASPHGGRARRDRPAGLALGAPTSGSPHAERRVQPRSSRGGTSLFPCQ